MKYQKSMMKLMENVLSNRDKQRSIESIIREASTGRNSSFVALKWLEDKGFVKIRSFGNQRIVRPVMDNYTLQYKYYLDSIEFKSLDPFVKLIVRIFVSEIFNNKKIKIAVLFGSVLKTKKYNDIDILLLGDGVGSKELKSFSKIREKVERIFGIIVNIHVGELNMDNLFKGIVIYQSSYMKFQRKYEEQYLEFLEWFLEALRNKTDKKIFSIAFNNAVVNLSYAYCYFNLLDPKTKEEAVKYLSKKGIGGIKELKKRGIEVGKKIFI